MRSRIRAVWLGGVALVALAPSSGAVAVAAHTGLALSRPAVDQPLTWAIVPSPNRGTGGNSLNGTSCTSAGLCTAVGYVALNGVPKTLVETWNGTAWSIVSSPSRSASSVLSGVSCLSASACTAVGTSYGTQQTEKTLIESWNGRAWSIVPSPNPSPAQDRDVLLGVSCISASACTAVGF